MTARMICGRASVNFWVIRSSSVNMSFSIREDQLPGVGILSFAAQPSYIYRETEPMAIANPL